MSSALLETQSTVETDVVSELHAAKAPHKPAFSLEMEQFDADEAIHSLAQGVSADRDSKRAAPQTQAPKPTAVAPTIARR